MSHIIKLHPQYVTNETGKKVAVLLPINEFEDLLEDLKDLSIVAERRDELTVSHEEVVKKLKKDGRL